MRYPTGEDVRLWDRAEAWEGNFGIVVWVSTEAYPAGHPGAAWAFLEQGVMIDTEQAGLIHYRAPGEEWKLLARGAEPGPEDRAELARRKATWAAFYRWRGSAPPGTD
jgi:hypothetical protein